MGTLFEPTPTKARIHKAAKLVKRKRTSQPIAGHEPGYSVQHKPDGRYMLSIFGCTTRDWVPKLCERLFEEQVNVISGDAVVDEKQSIRGRFELAPTRPNTRLIESELAKCLAEGIPAAFPSSIAITDYQVGPSSKFRESIHLRLEGLDRPGFLSGFFQNIDPFGLQLREMQITTIDRVVRDQFWFLPKQGHTTESAVAKLRTKMDSLVDYYWAN